MTLIKGYMVVDDIADRWDFEDECFEDSLDYCSDTTDSRADADKVVAVHGGRVLTIIDGGKYKPKDVNDRACAHDALSNDIDDAYEALGEMNGTQTVEDFVRALINGIDDEDKRYNVKVPHTKDCIYAKDKDGSLNVMYLNCGDFDRCKFTDAEINKYGLTDCECVEVQDD